MLYLSIQYLLGRGIWPPNASQIICFIHKSHQFTFCVLLSSASTDIRYDMRVEVVYISMDMLIYIYIYMYFIFVYKRDFDIHAKHQISLCVYIYEYMNVLVLVFICIHFTTTSIFFYVPHDPQSLLPQPNHWHIQASTVPRSDGLRLFSAPSKEFGTPNEGNGGRKGRGGLGSTAASEEQGLQNTALKVSLVFFFRWGD